MDWLELRKILLRLYAYEVPPSSLYDKIFQRVRDFIGMEMHTYMHVHMQIMHMHASTLT